MAMKDDLGDFLLHTALKWNQTRIQYPNTDRNTFFRRHALHLNMTAKKEVRKIVTAMLEYPDKADWVFDQHFHMLVPNGQLGPDCHPVDPAVKEKFDKGYIELKKQYGE
jgi:hypothetical protein